MLKILLLRSSLLILAILPFTTAQAQTLHLVTAALPPIAPTKDNLGYMGSIAREAFGRIGIQVSIDSLPGERALLNANAGLDDGDLLRIPGLEKVYPNLIRVPEKVMDFEFVAFTKNEKIQLGSLADLEPYTVAFTTGWKFYEHRVKKAREITRTRNLPSLFQLLKKGRAEIVLAERWQGLWEARQQGIRVKLLQPPFKISDMYIYLNKRHAALVPKVAQALVTMKQDGTFQRIVAEHLQSLETE